MTLLALRKKVDAIDRKIVDLLCARQKVVLGMDKFKKKITVRKREKKVLANVKRRAGKRIGAKFAAEIFRRIIRESKRAQKTLKGKK